MGPFHLLSPEVRSMIFSYLDRGDMTSLRATCSTLERVVPCNIDRVFISANSLNIQVFRAIADSELHRHKITEIIWDDARLPEVPEYREATSSDDDKGKCYKQDKYHVDYGYDYWNDDDDASLCSSMPEWFTRRCLDGGPDGDQQIPYNNSIINKSWKFYEELMSDQHKNIRLNADIEAFKYGLQRFTHLKRVTITPCTHGRQSQPLFRTPMISSFPFDFVYPSPRPWAYTGFDIEHVDAPWAPNNGHSVEYGYKDCQCRLLAFTAFHIKYKDVRCSCRRGKMSASKHDDYRADWRGFSLVTRALVECEQDHHVTELIIAGREIWTGVNCHVFDQKCQEYDDLVSLLKRPGFRRLDLDLNTFIIQRDEDGWKSYRSGLLREALAQAKDLRHISLRTTTDTIDGKCLFIDPKDEFKKTFPLEMILPFDQWPNLQHFGISNMLVTNSNLVSLLAALPKSLRSVELSNLGFAGIGGWWELLNEMRTKLDWRMRPVRERPELHMTVADLYFEDLEMGFYVHIDDAVASFMELMMESPQSSLEGLIDFSTGAGPLNPDELDKATGVLRRIIKHFEPLSTEKPYNRPRLVRLTYEYARSDQSKSNFLHAFLGAVNVTMDQVIDLDDETVQETIRLALNAFADFLIDNFFLPLKAAGSKTSQPSPAASSRITSKHPIIGSIERVASLRRDCLVRDQHRCAISRDFDMKEAERRIEESGYDYASDDQGQLLKEQEPGSFAELEVAHILPHSLMTTTGNSELNKSKETALAILDMFDHDIVHLIQGPDIDHSRNALTLKIDIHRQFGNFKVFFESTNQPNNYRVDTTLRQPFRNRIFPINRTFFLTPERTIDPPSARLLAVHHAICQILHLSAAGNYIDSILRDFEDGAVQSDGSTHLASLLQLRLDCW
ncbi:hypothetical protein FPSE5266_06725 [Fusarium pseudograminearum]|nr:hypothetical protein FPSE5266_06725 [Fusarium pseudograminearum]